MIKILLWIAGICFVMLIVFQLGADNRKATTRFLTPRLAYDWFNEPGTPAEIKDEPVSGNRQRALQCRPK